MSSLFARLFGRQPVAKTAPRRRGWFRSDPMPHLRRHHLQLLEQARDLQRKGDIQGFAVMTERAEDVARQIDALEGQAE